MRKPITSAAPTQRKNSAGFISVKAVAVVALFNIEPAVSLDSPYFERTLPKKPFGNIMLYTPVN